MIKADTRDASPPRTIRLEVFLQAHDRCDLRRRFGAVKNGRRLMVIACPSCQQSIAGSEPL